MTVNFLKILSFWQYEEVCQNVGKKKPSRLYTHSQEDLLEQEMASHSSILAWRIPWRSLVGYSPWAAKSQTRLRD